MRLQQSFFRETSPRLRASEVRGLCRLHALVDRRWPRHGWCEAMPDRTDRERSSTHAPRIAFALATVMLAAGCHRTTGTLSEEHQRRFESEGIVRRATDLFFRYTHDTGTRDAGWEEDEASIVVTRQSVVIHRGDRFRLEITPRSTGFYRILRDRDRLSLHAGSGKSAVSWSFRPPDDPAGWVEDIRAVIRGTAGAERRAGTTETPPPVSIRIRQRNRSAPARR
jgi:hypothetical protein